jgi:3-methyladenine DNA glycosylase Mpg
MPAIDRQQAILDLLKNLKGLDPLKQLFWSQLNYERVNTPLPPDYNTAVMKVKRRFAEEARTRQTEMKHTLALRQGQRYVLRELRILFSATEDEDVKAQITILEKAFRASPTEAVNRELNRLRREAITGTTLLKKLIDIYYQHNMKDWLERKSLQLQEDPIPIVVCSEKLG